jgi:hypothetical protein
MSWSSLLLYESQFILAAIVIKLGINLKSSKIFIYILSSVPLAIIAAIRSSIVGTDFWAYQQHIYEVLNSPFMQRDNYSSYFEFGYDLLINLISLITKNEILIILIVYLFIATLTIKSVSDFVGNKNAPYAIFLTLNIYWLQSYNTLRQSIVMALILIIITQRQKLSQYLLILLTATIHKTALLMILLPNMRNKLQLKKKGRMGVIYIVVSFILIYNFNELITEYILAYAQEINFGFNIQKTGNETTIVNGLLQVIVRLPLLILLASEFNKNNNLFLYTLLYIIFGIGYSSNEWIIRLLYIFEFPYFAYLYRVYSANNAIQIKVILNIYIIGYAVLYRFAYIYTNSGEVMPYKLNPSLF